METRDLIPVIESMIFVSDEPLSIKDFVEMFGEEVGKETLKEAIDVVMANWNNDAERGIQLCEVAGGYQFRTKPAYADYIKKLSVPKPMRLSAPALETLAIIAYKQPIIRSEMEQIRGVDSGGVIKTLLERNLIRIVGRKNEPGNPLIYGTSMEFLKLFNLGGLRDLPTLKDLDELAQQSSSQTSPDISDQSEQTPIIDDSFEDLSIVQDLEEEKKDRESLDELDETIKALRTVERSVFPRPLPEINIQNVERLTDGQSENTGEDETAETSGEDDESLSAGS